MGFIKAIFRLLGTILLAFIALIGFFLFSDDAEDTDVSTPTTTTTTSQTQSANLDTNSTDASSATVMLYLIGSDLESGSGCATTDLQEICDAELPDGMNFIIQTGGSKRWENSKINAKKSQRFIVEDGDITLVEENSRVLMTDPDSLSDFLQWGVDNYPADRYAAILWDHGGGSIMGYGADEYNEDECLELNEISKAFKSTGAHFDFIGFDACLMGTIETAYAIAPYADYLIASEETEPGTGWYYTDWLNKWSEDIGMSTALIGKEIVNSFIDGPDSSWWDDTTLSVVKLDEIPEVYETLCEYLGTARKTLRQEGYGQIANARSDVRSYGDGGYDQIDIATFVEKAELDNSDAILKAVKSAVVYYNGNTVDSTGLSMYYPYEYPNAYSLAQQEFRSFGMQNDNYDSFFSDFLSIMVNGKSVSRATKSAMSQLTGAEDTTTATDYTNETWYDAETAQTAMDTNALFNIGEDEDLTLTQSGDNYVLHLTDEQWATISKMDLSVYIDDGEGYLDFGEDSVGDFDDNGDLIVDFDYQWLTLNEQFVPFYSMENTYHEDGSWYATGYIPAVLNGDTDIEIIVRWDKEHEDGAVVGYRPAVDNDETMTLPSKNLLQFAEGDKLDFYFDYYTYDGEYTSSYALEEESVVVGAEGLNLAYMELSDEETTLISYRLTDLYQNEYWTEPVELS